MSAKKSDFKDTSINVTETLPILHGKKSPTEESSLENRIAEIAAELADGHNEHLQIQFNTLFDEIKQQSLYRYWKMRAALSEPETAIVFGRMSLLEASSDIERSEALANVADDLWRLGMPREGLEKCLESERIDPLPQTYTNKASCLVLLGDLDLANEVVNEGFSLGGEYKKAVIQGVFAGEPLCKTKAGKDLIRTVSNKLQ